MTKMVLGVFSEQEDAKEAIDSLQARGYNPKDVSIVMKDNSKAKDVAEDTGADVAGGALSGATTGGIVGALAGLLAATVIPGLGAFFIGGPIAAALGLGGAAASTISGAATGALAGGILGALTGFGLSEEEAMDYEQRIKQGGILVAVPARSGEDDAVRSIMDDSDADEIKVTDLRDDYVGHDRTRTPDSPEYRSQFAQQGREDIDLDTSDEDVVVIEKKDKD